MSTQKTNLKCNKFYGDSVIKKSKFFVSDCRFVRYLQIHGFYHFSKIKTKSESRKYLYHYVSFLIGSGIFLFDDYKVSVASHNI